LEIPAMLKSSRPGILPGTDDSPATNDHRLEACTTSSAAICLQAFDPEADLEIYERHLPHWHQPGATYFVTFRLADSLPRSALDALREERRQWLARHPTRPPDAIRGFQRLFSERIEQYLHAGYGDCILRRPEVANLVESSLRHFHAQRYLLDDYVIMPNHVHVLVTLQPDRGLSDVLHSWKSFTANQINRVLNRTGRLWQEESYDHILRDEEELIGYRQYIAANPAKAGLSVGNCRVGTARSTGFQPVHLDGQ
jgi:REP element-mobilizing transposase RayT